MYCTGAVSKIVNSQFESNSQHHIDSIYVNKCCVKDRQFTIWKQFTTGHSLHYAQHSLCQRSSIHNLKAIHNSWALLELPNIAVSKIVNSQFESNSQQMLLAYKLIICCVKDRQFTIWKQFTTLLLFCFVKVMLCQRSSIHNLKAIHNKNNFYDWFKQAVSKIVNSQFESNSQLLSTYYCCNTCCVKDRQFTIWKQFTTVKVLHLRFS